MSDYKKSTGKSVFKQIATWLGIVLLAIILLGGAVMLLTESRKDSFYVQYNGKKYSSDTTTSTPLAPAYRYLFEIRTFLGKKKDYTVKITANPETNFSFTVMAKITVSIQAITMRTIIRNFSDLRRLMARRF